MSPEASKGSSPLRRHRSVCEMVRQGDPRNRPQQARTPPTAVRLRIRNVQAHRREILPGRCRRIGRLQAASRPSGRSYAVKHHHSFPGPGSLALTWPERSSTENPRQRFGPLRSYQLPELSTRLGGRGLVRRAGIVDSGRFPERGCTQIGSRSTESRKILTVLFRTRAHGARILVKVGLRACPALGFVRSYPSPADSNPFLFGVHRGSPERADFHDSRHADKPEATRGDSSDFGPSRGESSRPVGRTGGTISYPIRSTNHQDRCLMSDFADSSFNRRLAEQGPPTEFLPTDKGLSKNPGS